MSPFFPFSSFSPPLSSSPSPFSSFSPLSSQTTESISLHSLSLFKRGSTISTKTLKNKDSFSIAPISYKDPTIVNKENFSFSFSFSFWERSSFRLTILILIFSSSSFLSSLSFSSSPIIFFSLKRNEKNINFKKSINIVVFLYFFFLSFLFFLYFRFCIFCIFCIFFFPFSTSFSFIFVIIYNKDLWKNERFEQTQKKHKKKNKLLSTNEGERGKRKKEHYLKILFG